MTEKKKPAENDTTSKKTELAITKKKPGEIAKEKIRFSSNVLFRPV